MAEPLEYNMRIEYGQFLQGSRQATTALTNMDKTAKQTDAAFDDLYNSGTVLGKGMTKTAQEVGKATSGFKTMRGALSQVGYQIQDVAVQAQMGTDSLIILGQQGPQIASVFGPGGAVIGALIAVGAVIGTVFASSVDSASESVDEMIDRIDELGVAQRELLKIKIGKEMIELGNETDKAWAKVQVLNDEINKQERILKNINDGTASGWLTDIVLSSEDVEDKISGLNEDLITAQANLEQLQSRSKSLKGTMDELGAGMKLAAEQTKKANETFVELSQSLAVQVQLAGKSEREQAKIAAAYELGAGATEGQVQAVNLLIDAYYNEMDVIEQQESAQRALAQARKKDEDLLISLSNTYDVAALKAQGLDKQAFILAQTQKLSAAATEENIAKVKELADAIFTAQQSTTTKKEDNQAANFIEKLMEQQATELELISIHEQQKLETLMDYYLQGQYSYQQFQDGITAIGEQAAKQRMAFDALEAQSRLSAFSSMFSNLSQLMNTESRKAFEIGKTAAIAETIVSTYSSAQKSYDALAGIPIVGPALGAAAAAAAIAGGFARVQAIESQSFSRGGMTAANQPVIPSQPTAPEQAQQGNRLDINITGASDSKFGGIIVDLLNDAIDEGSNIKVNAG